MTRASSCLVAPCINIKYEFEKIIPWSFVCIKPKRLCRGEKTGNSCNTFSNYGTRKSVMRTVKCDKFWYQLLLGMSSDRSVRTAVILGFELIILSRQSECHRSLKLSTISQFWKWGKYLQVWRASNFRVLQVLPDVYRSCIISGIDKVLPNSVDFKRTGVWATRELNLMTRELKPPALINA